MKFQKHSSLWDWQSSGVSARNRFRRSMAPNFLWKYPCAKRNLRYITPSSSIPEIDTQWNLNKLLNQVNCQQRSCGNESKNLTTAPRPYLVSRRILGSSSRETVLYILQSESSWYQEGLWRGGQVFRRITTTALLMVRLTEQLVKVSLTVNL